RRCRGRGGEFGNGRCFRANILARTGKSAVGPACPRAAAQTSAPADASTSSGGAAARSQVAGCEEKSTHRRGIIGATKKDRGRTRRRGCAHRRRVLLFPIRRLSL